MATRRPRRERPPEPDGASGAVVLAIVALVSFGALVVLGVGLAFVWLVIERRPQAAAAPGPAPTWRATPTPVVVVPDHAEGEAGDFEIEPDDLGGIGAAGRAPIVIDLDEPTDDARHLDALELAERMVASAHASRGDDAATAPAGTPEEQLAAYRRDLRDPDAAIRRAAASGLARLGDLAAPAVSDLAAALGDDDFQTRRLIASALGGLGPLAAPAIPELSEALHAGSIANEAAAALAAVGPGGLPPLVEAIAEGQRHVREAAAQAVTSHDDPTPAIPLLRERFVARMPLRVGSHEELDDHEITTTLLSIGGREVIVAEVVAALGDPEREVQAREVAFRLADELDLKRSAEVVDVLCAILDGEGDPMPGAKGRAVQPLRQGGDDPVVRKALPSLIRHVTTHATFDGYAVEAIDDMGGLDELAKLIETSEDARVRGRAIQALNSLRGPKARPYLASLVAATKDPDEHVRSWASSLVIGIARDGQWAKFTDEEAAMMLPVFQEMARKSRHSQGLEAIGFLGEKAAPAIPMLVAWLEKRGKAPENQSSRRYWDYKQFWGKVIRVVERIGIPAGDAIPVLREIRDEEGSPLVEDATRALRAIRPERTE